MKQIDINIIKNILANPKKIAILTHKNPDGDAIGSSLGLYHFLKKLNHNVVIVSPNDFPDFLRWLNGSDEIINTQKNRDLAIASINNADIIFCLDFNSIERTNFIKDVFIISGGIKILIDHHPQPETFCDYAMTTTETSSTAELIYDFIVYLERTDLIDKDIAEALYVGIMTDTGSFAYSCNLPKTYIAVAELIKHNLDVQRIHNLVYDTYSENRMRLLGFSLNTAMKVMPDCHTAYIALSKYYLDKYNHRIGDTEGFVNYPISMQGICFSALFMEFKDHIKISFRSKGDFNVNDFARKHFEGGGHKNASGGKSKLSLKETVNKFELLITEYKHQIICP